MWTILFGSIVNKTSHFGGIRGLLIANSIGMLLFVFISFRYLRLFSLKMDCIAQSNRLKNNTRQETLVVTFNALMVVVGTYLIFFDLYHQNILSAASGGGLARPGEIIEVPLLFYRLRVLVPTSRFFAVITGILRRLFNPMVFAGKTPLLSLSVWKLVGKFFVDISAWFEGSNLGDSMVQAVKVV